MIRYILLGYDCCSTNGCDPYAYQQCNQNKHFVCNLFCQNRTCHGLLLLFTTVRMFTCLWKLSP